MTFKGQKFTELLTHFIVLAVLLMTWLHCVSLKHIRALAGYIRGVNWGTRHCDMCMLQDLRDGVCYILSMFIWIVTNKVKAFGMALPRGVVLQWIWLHNTSQMYCYYDIQIHNIHIAKDVLKSKKYLFTCAVHLYTHINIYIWPICSYGCDWLYVQGLE